MGAFEAPHRLGLNFVVGLAVVHDYLCQKDNHQHDEYQDDCPHTQTA